MKNHALALLCAAGLAASLSACAFNQYTLDIPEQGGSVRMAAANQTLNPAPASEDPVVGLDGVKARVAMDVYQTGQSRETGEQEKMKSALELLKAAK